MNVETMTLLDCQAFCAREDLYCLPNWEGAMLAFPEGWEFSRGAGLWQAYSQDKSVMIPDTRQPLLDFWRLVVATRIAANTGDVVYAKKIEPDLLRLGEIAKESGLSFFAVVRWADGHAITNIKSVVPTCAEVDLATNTLIQAVRCTEGASFNLDKFIRLMRDGSEQ
jgi:hypothetical protein